MKISARIGLSPSRRRALSDALITRGLSGLLIGTLLVGGTATDPEAATTPPQPPLGSPAHPGRAQLQYWGITDSGTYFETVPLDATVPANLGVAHPDRVLPLTIDIARVAFTSAKGQPPPPPPPGGFTCARLVGATHLDATIHYLGANVSQQCSGAFTQQWIEYRVERSSYTGYRTFKNWEATQATSATEENWPVGARCTAGGGIYDYRVTTIGHARAANGVDVVDLHEVYGQPGRFNCGTE